MAVRATPKALRKIRADSKVNHDGDPEAYSKLEAVRSAWVCYIPTAISGTATIFCIFGANVLNKHQQAALTSAYALLNDSYNNYKDTDKDSDLEEIEKESSSEKERIDNKKDAEIERLMAIEIPSGLSKAERSKRVAERTAKIAKLRNDAKSDKAKIK